jgi:hypothetical protein
MASTIHRRVPAEPNVLPDIHMPFSLFHRAFSNSPTIRPAKDASRVKQIFIMSKDTEEATKESARKVVTEGPTDPDTIRLLSAAGDVAKRSRPNSPLPHSRLQQVHIDSWNKSEFFD